MSIYSIVYLCPGSGSRRTEMFKDVRVSITDGCLIVGTSVVIGAANIIDGHVMPPATFIMPEMILPPGHWYSVRRLPDDM